ncbi:hypothetical protein [Amphritea japonica]|uniref:hypothetical protein n=1 Tax=Amphritea japonica TaxID=452627 RepID=UPI00036E1C19|nr:hypothetical protein [Amphritea japonica]
MKKKAILHIGRHKSGTSSIQKVLSENDSILEEYLFKYPRGSFYKGYAHHNLAVSLRRSVTNKLSSKELDLLVKKKSKELDLIKLKENEVLILSSESFQNSNPKVIRKVFDESGFDVTIVCYLREQVGYIASAYNQKVHAGDYDKKFDEFFDGFELDYSKFVNSWVCEFSNVRFRLFDRKSLIDGDVVSDFFKSVLGINDVLIRSADNNNSLSRKYLSFKLMFNMKEKNILEEQQRKKLYVGLAQMSLNDDTGVFRASFSMADEIFERVCESNNLISTKYLENGVLRLSKGGDDSLFELSDNEFLEIRNKVLGI